MWIFLREGRDQLPARRDGVDGEVGGLTRLTARRTFLLHAHASAVEVEVDFKIEVVQQTASDTRSKGLVLSINVEGLVGYIHM